MNKKDKISRILNPWIRHLNDKPDQQVPVWFAFFSVHASIHFKEKENSEVWRKWRIVVETVYKKVRRIVQLCSETIPNMPPEENFNWKKIREQRIPIFKNRVQFRQK